MKLKYTGNMDIFPFVYGTRRYIFDKRTDFTLEVPEKDASRILRYASHNFKVLPDTVLNKVVSDSTKGDVSSTGDVSTTNTERPRRGRPRRNA